MIARTFESDGDEAATEDLGGPGKGRARRDGDKSKPLSRRVRGVVSVLLALHLMAIAAAPLAMEPASLPAQKVFAVFRPYLDAAFLNHGYHFFAPEPGPSHLIRYELTFADGRVENGVFPDPAEQKPRLNYHRHFMLSEFANRLAVNDSQQPALHELSRSFARHLMSERDAESATLFLRRHYIPSPQQVREGMTLEADELYAERPLGSFSLGGVSALADSSGGNRTADAVGSLDSRRSLDSGGSRDSGGSLDSGRVPDPMEPAAVRLTGRLQLPGDLEAGRVIR